MQFLQNIWYFAAWSADVTRKPLARVIIEQPVVLYRSDSGDLAALQDRCPHRFTPLSLGKVIGETLECLYHGLRFDKAGACVHNPHGASIPRGAFVKRYPVAERDGIIWIWMGEEDLADELSIVRFPMLNQSDAFTYTCGQTMDMPLSYELMTDNLMDLSHVNFTHAAAFGTPGLVPGHTEVTEEGGSIWSYRLAKDTSPAGCFSGSGACSADDKVDYWLDIRWSAPASFYLSAGHAPAGEGRQRGAELSSVQVVTPVSDARCYYFFKHFRNYRRDDEALTQELERSIRHVFATEDEPMIAEVQRAMAGRDLLDMKPVFLACDAAPFRVRQARAKLLEQEMQANSFRKNG